MNNSTKILSIGLLTAGCIGIGLFLAYILTLSDTPLSEQKNTEEMGLIAVKSLNDSGSTITTYRLSDAKEQVFSGDWNITFTKPNEVLLFGAKTEMPKQQYFMVFSSKTGTIKDVSQLPGFVTGVAPSQNSTYLLINGIKKTSTSTPGYYLCVIGKNNLSYAGCRTVLGDIIDKNTQDTAIAYHAYWNREKDNELIIQETAGRRRIWTYDAGDHKLQPFDTNNRTLPAQVALAGSKNTKEYAVKRFGPIALITQIKGSGKYTFFLPTRETLIPLGNQFALALNGGKLSLINMATKNRSEIATLPTATSREIISYYE